jgi:threonyl-tRNA synthetase
MIHRVVFGSLERFIGILIEHYAGKFPLWLAPLQVKVLPISDRFVDYAKDVLHSLKQRGVRCELDQRDEKIGYKIRMAQLEKVPYMLIVGQKEEESKMISVRDRDQGDMGMAGLEELLAIIDNAGLE